MVKKRPNLLSSFFQKMSDITASPFPWLGTGRRDNLVNVSLIGYQGPVWIDTAYGKEVYFETPQIKLVYDRFVSMYTNMKILKVKTNSKGMDEVVEDVDLMRLFDQPNPAQSNNAWLAERALQLLLFGNRFTYKNKPSTVSKYPQALWNMSPLYITPVLTGKIFDQVKLSGIISHYEYRDPRYGNKDVKTDEMLWSKIPGLDDPLKGVSKLKGYTMPISNIQAAYEYLNVISARRGAIGMLSNESAKDSMGGSYPLEKDEKQRIYDKHIEGYGISPEQKHIILTEASLKWTPMSYPTKDLLLLEQIEANTLTIIDSLHMNANIFAQKNVTYENIRQGYIQTYTDAIQPFADLDMQELTRFLEIEPGYRLKASYDHLQIMKENKLKNWEGISKVISSLQQLVDTGLLAKPAAMAILETELRLS